jgi:hypothetical protein
VVGDRADAEPDSGISSGRRFFNSRIERVMRRAGTLASTRACACEDDQILERESPRAARAARLASRTRRDQRADGAARQAQQALDIVHAVAFCHPAC